MIPMEEEKSTLDYRTQHEKVVADAAINHSEDRLAREVVALGEVVEHLIKRLSPVMSERPDLEDASTASEGVRGTSRVVRFMHEQASRLREIQVKLDDALSRLEV